MKKILVTFLVLMSMLPCFASEQSVMIDATAAFNAAMRGASQSNLSQVDKDVLGLGLVGMQYMGTLRGDDLINAGNLMLRKLPYTKAIAPSKKPTMKFMAHMFVAVGRALCFEFTDAHKHLNQMNLIKNQVPDGAAQYDNIKNTITTIETVYSQAKNQGYNTDEQRMRLMIKRQLGM